MDATDKSSFKLSTQKFKQETDLILRKGVYPYEYIDSQDAYKLEPLHYNTAPGLSLDALLKQR